jgi:hypothetical protein
MTRKEVAEKFSLSWRTIKRMEEDGRLPRPIWNASGTPFHKQSVIDDIFNRMINGEVFGKGSLSIATGDYTFASEEPSMDVQHTEDRIPQPATIELNASEVADSLPEQNKSEKVPPAKHLPEEYDLGVLVFELLRQKFRLSWFMIRPWIIHPSGGLSLPVALVLYSAYVVWLVPPYLSV